jgi:hypothetical protein
VTKLIDPWASLPCGSGFEFNGDLTTIMWAAPSSQRYNRVYAVGVDFVWQLLCQSSRFLLA